MKTKYVYYHHLNIRIQKNYHRYSMNIVQNSQIYYRYNRAKKIQNLFNIILKRISCMKKCKDNV